MTLVRMLSVFLLALILGTVGGSAFAQDKKKDIARIKDLVSDAGKKYKDGDFDAAAILVNQAAKDLQATLKGSDARVQKQVEPLYQKLEKAHQLLSVEGVSLDPLGDWKSIIEGKVPTKDNGKISFTKDLAPWMVQQCGRCHVTGTRGNYSMQTFVALMKGPPAGTVVFPNDSAGSRLVQVIAEGDMPRGGAKVSEENLNKLKKWIDQGAQFDGPDPSVTLTELAKAAGGGEPAPDPAKMITKPTGGETVSFAKQIAPLLVANCMNCHINARRPSGNLRLDNFAQTMRGGDSGPIIVPKKPDDSLLIKKLQGLSGQRMPVNRPAFTDEQIKLISTWISEGASFDGATPDTAIEQVASRAWADSASESDLRNKRLETALKQWKVVAPNAKPEDASDDSFFVFGDIGPEGLKEILHDAHEAEKVVRKQLKIPDGSPIVKGGVAIFVFNKKYDYGEFGKMVESRTLPPEWSSHWRKGTVDAYVVMHYDANSSAKNRNMLVQQLSSVHLGAMEGVPQWFADGVGRSVVSQTAGKDDSRIAQWQSRLPVVSQQLKEPKQLLEGKLGEEEAALVGFYVARGFTEKGNRKAFDQFLKMMRGGTPFDQAFTKIYGQPEPFLRNFLGLQK